MWADLLFILLGLILLFFGAEFLVRGAIALALRMGISPLIVGLTVLAFCTSSPELVVGLRAAYAENGGIVIGNVLGSNIANTGLILGLAALIYPLQVHRQIIRREIPVMLTLTLLAVFFISSGVIGRLEGMVLFIGLLAYVVYSVISARESGESAPVEEVEAIAPKSTRHWVWDIALLAFGLGILTGGAELMVKGAVNVATMLGASEALVGLTIVAIGTSLPELATSLVAACRKEGDLMVGNLIGSNIFNIGAILGAVSLVYPVTNEGISRLDMLLFVVFSMALLPIMKTGYQVSRIEGAALLTAYFSYLIYLVLQV